MNSATIRQLDQLNKQFYAQIHQEFAQSRAEPWEGWQQLLEFWPESVKTAVRIKVLDIGCGTGRFGHFLQQETKPIVYYGIDNSAELLTEAQQKLGGFGSFIQVELVEELLTQEHIFADISQTFAVVSMFGVLHHIPSRQLRQKAFCEMAAALQPDGRIWLATWQFNQPRFAQKYIQPQSVGVSPEELEPNDFFLPWDRGGHAVRYCHLTTDEEVADLAKEAGLKFVHQFVADGRTHDLNHYFVLTRK
jgi:SAM-dependent methyltransferase